MNMEKDNKKNTKLESISSIDKIMEIQKLLNKLKLAKMLFKETEDKATNKLNLKNKLYFESKVKIKEVFDTNVIEKQMTYTLIDNPEQSLALSLYKSLYDFYFLIRNDHLLLLNIIEIADKSIYKELSYFLVHFLYENLTNESYTENKLIIMFYLLLEKLIIKDLPDSIDEKNENIPSTFLNETFIFYMNKNLTRKLNLRNFLNDILKRYILRMENHKQFLTVEISVVNQFLENNQSEGFTLEKGKNDNEKFFEEKEIVKENENEIDINKGDNKENLGKDNLKQEKSNKNDKEIETDVKGNKEKNKINKEEKSLNNKNEIKSNEKDIKIEQNENQNIISNEENKNISKKININKEGEILPEYYKDLVRVKLEFCEGWIHKSRVEKILNLEEKEKEKTKK
jgi:hypothetical protein